MRELKIFLFTIIVGGLGLLFLNNNKVNASENISQESYSNYYENSDLVYEMSDLSNITPYLYNNEEVLIDDYNDKLFKSNLKISAAATRATAYGDDPIVNIIPKELFTEEVNITICSGEEYVYAIETKYVDYSRSPYYESHVMVIDIDNNIKNNSFDIESNLIKVSITKLFEYKYLTLLKEYDYGNPEGLRDTVNFNSFIKVENFDDDYIVVPKPTDGSMMNFYSPNEWTLNNINVIGSLKNINALNVYDEDYCLSDDKGFFFIGSGVEYNCHSIVFDETADFKQALLSMTDYISYIPGLSEVKLISTALSAINLGNSLVGTFKNLASTSSSIIENTYTSNASFASPDHYYYSTTQGQINNYSELIKSESAHIYTIPLTKNSDYAEIDFHYSYTDEVATMFSQLVSFDFTIGKDVYSVVSGKESAIGVKNVDIDTTDYISNEYNCIGGKTAYNITPQYSQNYSINCGENDVIIYDVDQNIVSTSKNCYLEKNKTYSICVINNSDESIIYDFFMSGYDISESARLDSLESAQYTFISDINGVRCITSNYDIEDMDLMYFNEGNVYQIIITNNTNTSGIAYLNIEEIPDATFDSEGHISNDSKYVRFNEAKGIYKIEYNSVYKYFVVVDKTLKGRTAAFIKYKARDEIYFITSYIDAIRLADYDYNIVFNRKLVEDNSENYTIDKTNQIYLQNIVGREFNVRMLSAIYDTTEDHFDPHDNSLEFKQYGYYCLLIAYQIENDEMVLSDYETTRIYVYYLPNYSKITLESIKYIDYNKKYSFSLSGALNYISFNLSFGESTFEYTNSDGSCSEIGIDRTYSFDCLNMTDLLISLDYLSSDSVFNEIDFDFEIAPNVYSVFDKVSSKKLRMKLSYFDLIKDGYSYIYGISRYEQLKMALLYSQYGSFSYSDYVNDDIEIYGDINDLRFRLLNNIMCNDEIVINDYIIFNGEFDGQGNIIRGLKVSIIHSSNSKGIFSQNYGYIHDVDFINCTLSIGDVKCWNTTAGLITANNYGIIDVTISGTCLYIYNGDNRSKALSSTTLYF